VTVFGEKSSVLLGEESSVPGEVVMRGLGSELIGQAVLFADDEPIEDIGESGGGSDELGDVDVAVGKADHSIEADTGWSLPDNQSIDLNAGLSSQCAANDGFQSVFCRGGAEAR
jgi:hypothetical protein